MPTENEKDSLLSLFQEEKKHKFTKDGFVLIVNEKDYEKLSLLEEDASIKMEKVFHYIFSGQLKKVKDLFDYLQGLRDKRLQDESSKSYQSNEDNSNNYDENSKDNV
jgi:hypothetical protein